MSNYCYVYVLRSLADGQFYVGLPRDLQARLQAHNKGLVASIKRRRPFELVYWEGCLNESDAAQREKYLKTAWVSGISKRDYEDISRGKGCEHDDDLARKSFGSRAEHSRAKQAGDRREEPVGLKGSDE